MPGNAAEMITVWENDPSSGRLRTAAKPDVNKQPLGFLFPPPPPINDDPDTVEFRYWTAAEALRRGADFWAPVLNPPGEWNRGPVLDVHLDRWEALQSDYDRLALNFYHGSARARPEIVVYSGATPDLLCHELGHAILDAIEPNLLNRGLAELDAFHESFGDMSAILCALQVPEFRATVLTETNGNFWSSSSLSRIAEQFGAVLRAGHPNQADADCLRNAWNHHNYSAPAGLQEIGGPDELASNPHSFSRVFTGAFYEAFSGILAAKANSPQRPTSAELQAASLHMRDILVAGVRHAPIVADYFAQVASGMVQASAAIDPAYPAVFADVFSRRAILPVAIV